MIKVQKSKISDLSCFVCNSKTGVKEIYFRQRHQGICVALCSSCRAIAAEKILKSIAEEK